MGILIMKFNLKNSPERAKRLSEGRSPSKKCVKIKPCKGVRIMRAALSGLKILSNANVGLRPSLRRDALSGLFLRLNFIIKIPINNHRRLYRTSSDVLAFSSVIFKPVLVNSNPLSTTTAPLFMNVTS